MANTRFIFRNAPFRFLAEQLAQDADFLQDAQCILAIDEDAYPRLATRLAQSDAFLGRSALATIVSEVLGEGSDQIASIVYRLGGIIHEANMDAMEAANMLGKAIEEKAESLKPQDRRTLVDRICKLVAEPVGIAKQYKARQLVDAIVAELDTFRIICDIRPIFDDKRERIDGAIPLAILRLEYSKPDGETDVVELRVTEEQLARLGERITDASLKLKLIKDLLAGEGIPIPRTKSTIAEDDCNVAVE